MHFRIWSLRFEVLMTKSIFKHWCKKKQQHGILKLSLLFTIDKKAWKYMNNAILYKDNKNWLKNKNVHCNSKRGVSVLKHPAKKSYFCFFKFLQNAKKQMVCVNQKLNLIYNEEMLKLKICNIHFVL